LWIPKQILTFHRRLGISCWVERLPNSPKTIFLHGFGYSFKFYSKKGTTWKEMEKFSTYPSEGYTITVLATGHKKCDISFALTVKLNQRQTSTYRMQFIAAPFEHWTHGLEFRLEHGCSSQRFCVVLSPNRPAIIAPSEARFFSSPNRPAFYRVGTGVLSRE
jgi:hypothetical protein